MKENIKIFNVTFDTKVKVLIIICVVIATMIICYTFYYIIINEGDASDTKNGDINSILDIKCYEAEYDITVNGNRTINCYNVKEDVDLENNIYNMVINDTLNISINSTDTKIVKDKMENDYVINTNEILENNAISFSSIISCYKKISNNEIEGNITRIEQDDRYIYCIVTNEEYIKKVKKIQITTLKDNCKIIEIKMYNSDENELYSMVFKSFIVKK